MEKIKENIKKEIIKRIDIIKKKKEELKKREELKKIGENKKIIIKILTIGILLLGLPIIILGYYTGRENIDKIKAKLGNEGLEIIELRIKSILRSIEIINEVNKIAIETEKIINIEEDIIENYKELSNFFREQVLKINELDYIYIGTERGQFLGVKKLKDKSLRLIQGEGFKRPSMISFKINEKGEKIKEEDIEILRDLYDPRTRRWYLDVFEDNNQRWSAAYKFASEETLGITSIIPIFREENLIGVLGIDLNLDIIKYYISNIYITENTLIFIVDKQGNIITHTDKNLELEEINIYKKSGIIRDIYLNYIEKNTNEKINSFSIIRENDRYQIFTRK
ncbi:cache domain-containing protein, partial [Arthrospira platensis SPKY2]